MSSRSSTGRAIGAIVLTLAVAFAAPAAGAAAPASLDAHAAATCKTKAKIAGKTVCLAAGKTCKPKYERTYRTKRFTCQKNAAGRYRLQKRNLVF